ncbi:YajG family lipoprotein [Photobacterium toruni]|uniref:Lipoprotein n=1 Tax=Photobacterium toruni TaxID=1935446 RepID=A0A1T4JRY1_9GAMM|nr:YajG family lipoprotein [Photobacterium toruni]SJZ32874.1 hypothetical protein CZ814_00029 [Photobacterium toruni]
MIKKYFVLVSTLLLSACAATPPAPLALMPTAVFTPQPWAHNKTLNLSCIDKAPNSYIAVIDNGSTENVQVIQPQQPISLTLHHVLAQQLAGQGFRINNHATSIMAVTIEKALVTIKQGLVKYNMHSELQLQLSVKTPNGQFIKRYSGNSSREDALTASNKDIATSMNKLINSILNEIANDSELNKYLTENI